MARAAKTETPETPADADDNGRVPLAVPAPKTVRLEAVVSFNQHLVGERWEASLDENTLALVDKGWVDVVGIDGFELPTAR